LVLGGFALWFFVLNDAKENKQMVSETSETQQVIDPNAPNERYLTQDLRMYGLFGPVRDYQTFVSKIDGPSPWEFGDEGKYYDGLSQSEQFDEQGHLINFPIEKIAKRDGDRVLEIREYIGDFDICISHEWSYYPNGLMKQSIINGIENHEITEYFYNEQGELLRTESTYAAEGDQFKTITKYTIKDCDKNGNWTKRFLEVTEYEYSYDIEDYLPQAVRHEEENRIIRYYGQESAGQYVVINATELRLRYGPSKSADTFKWEDGTNRHPQKGEWYPYLGESGDFYKIDYKGNELWVSKQYTYLE
jgi:hypothetical protein